MALRIMRRFDVLLLIALSIGISLSGCDSGRRPLVPPRLSLAASIYVGWMPWFLAAQDGTLAQHAKEHGLDIQFVQGDYLETVNQLANGKVDAVTVTNMDAMAFLAGEGVASDVILISSYSHGNDAILLRPQAADDVTRGPIGLVEFSVSHYLLDRYLERENIPHDAVQRRHVSDASMAVVFEDPMSELLGVVTWNPILRKIENRLKVRRIFDSRMIEGEIADMLVIRRAVLQKHPEFAQALLATWFDMMERMRGSQRFADLERMAQLAQADLEGYEQELTTTLFMKTPEIALGYLRDPHLRDTMGCVRAFIARHNFVSEMPSEPWVSYAGDPSALLHFNDRSLLRYLGR